jgi:hypothetical protein
MYNHYIRNENGAHMRMPQPTPPLPDPPLQTAGNSSARTKEDCKQSEPIPPPNNENSRFSDSLTNFLQHILDRFHLDHVDTGDLMLLAFLFFLFRENADEEVLVALGLLLIL